MEFSCSAYARSVARSGRWATENVGQILRFWLCMGNRDSIASFNRQSIDLGLVLFVCMFAVLKGKWKFTPLCAEQGPALCHCGRV